MADTGCLPDPGFWRGRRVLLTGHTGFIGGWTALWLARLGARVHGFALPPSWNPSLFEAAGVGDALDSTLADLRDTDRLAACVAAADPEVVLHLAAQPLVRQAHAAPAETFAVNTQGTVDLLDALRDRRALGAVVVFTTDKVYRNVERREGYAESDELGGREPYGASKAAAEIVVEAFRAAYFDGARIATVRAGNVVGGGDWGAERLVPDAMRAFAAGDPLVLRRPEAVRPWQHVLEPVRGLLVLAERLHGAPADFAEGWNLGPDQPATVSVGAVAERLATLWGDGAVVEVTRQPDAPYEATLLAIDPARAAARFGWRTRLDLDETLEWTVAWYRAQRDGADMAALCGHQIAAYEERTGDLAHGGPRIAEA